MKTVRVFKESLFLQLDVLWKLQLQLLINFSSKSLLIFQTFHFRKLPKVYLAKV